MQSNPSPAPGRPADSRSRVAVIVAAVAVILYLLAPAFMSRIAPSAYSGGRSERQADIVQRNTSSVGLILGEFRSSMSDLMYIKTERYLDNGIAYHPHIDMKAMESEGKIQSHDESESEAAAPPAAHAGQEHEHEGEAGHDEESTVTVAISDIQFLQGDRRHEHEHGEEGHAEEGHEGETPEEHAAHSQKSEYTKTIIREQADDFRGFIGYLERNVKPWRDPRAPHQHTTGTELLPWFRLQTISDPHNVRSYLIGSWWLKTKDEVQVREALKFVEEGIQNNPHAFQLYLMKGTILRALGREADSAPAFERAAEEAMAMRPPLGDKNENAEKLGWDRYKEQDARTAARMAVLVGKKVADREHALHLARQYSAVFTEDPILERQIRILTGQEEDPTEPHN